MAWDTLPGHKTFAQTEIIHSKNKAKLNDLKFLKKYNGIIFGLFLVIHFLIKDAFWPYSVIFYGNPLPVLILLSILFLYLNRNNPFSWRIHKIITLILIVVWLMTSYKWGKADADVHMQKSIRVFLWNVACMEHPNSELVQRIQETSPDIVGIIEAGGVITPALHFYKATFPDYSIRRLPGNMMCFIRGKIHAIDYYTLGDRSRYLVLEISINKEAYHVILVDIVSNPFISRRNSLRNLLDTSLSYNRTFVMGDFNTPYNSVFFQEYKQQYYHAFQEAGSGFTATWPYGVPLLQIDHIWTSKELLPVHMEKTYHWSSDHALLIVDVIRHDQ